MNKAVIIIKWIAICILSLFWAAIAYMMYETHLNKSGGVWLKSFPKELTVNLNRPYSADALKACISVMIDEREKRDSSGNYDILDLLQPSGRYDFEKVYYEAHPEFDKIDFESAVDNLNAMPNDTIYMLSSYCVGCVGESYLNTELAAYSSARTISYDFANTCQYDSVMVEIHDEIFSRVFNPEMSVKGGFVDRYMCDDIGAKIVVEDDTIRTGTLYYLMFIPERL